MNDFEKPGAFYLGRYAEGGNFLYDAKNFTTHAVCVGMTGSGKTGLGITILEEAGLDKIPAIIIDPKGDLGDLLLTFPGLTPEEFKPWIDPAEAARKGMDLGTYAEEVATKWKKGLKDWGEGQERIKAFRNAVDLKIYTPASNSGIPISILNSFAAPEKDELDAEGMRERIVSTTSSLLGLLGINADPIKSREHILIATIIDKAWQEGRDVDIATLIKEVQKPPFTKIGALDVDTFYPFKERMELSISLNNLLAAPGFSAWMEGEPLDIKKLLYTNEGKPKLSIISIAHLSDSERMFFVTLLLNAFIGWMRRQEGTSSLRALLYMDEIFGYFPPTAMPPSKLPMLTLLKQARAYGVGVILVTQNPVDLDYKGLANCGTWFIGKLQTERDKARVVEGLSAASNGEIDAKELDKMISGTGNRKFIMRSIHEKEPFLFETRFTLSYLSGPLTLAQISRLTEKKDVSTKEKKQSVAAARPTLSVEEFFFNQGKTKVHYEPRVLAIGKVHFVDAKNKINVWDEVCLAVPSDPEGKSVDFSKGENNPELKDGLEKAPLPESTFEELPAGLMQEKTYKSFEKSFRDFLYQNQTYSIFTATELKMTSKQSESESDFRVRCTQALREKRDEDIKKVEETYADKITALSTRLKKAENKMSDKKQRAFLQIGQTILSFIMTVIGALVGKKVTKGTITETGTSIRRAGDIEKKRQAANDAEEDVQTLQQKLNDLEDEKKKEISALSIDVDPEKLNVETFTLHPKKSDIVVEKIALAWI